MVTKRVELIVESKRDRRVLDWMVAQVGYEAVAEACGQLVGMRRAYPSNVAKVLGLKPPKELALSSREDAKHHLDAITRVLGAR